MPPKKTRSKAVQPPIHSVAHHIPSATQVSELVGTYISFNPRHIPSCGDGGLSLYELNHAFLAISGYEKMSIESTLSRLEPRYRPIAETRKYQNAEGATDAVINIDYAHDLVDGIYLYKVLIAADPSTVFASSDVIEQLHIESFDLNNLIKQADKYGDKDGFVGYCDFLNITLQAGLWELSKEYPTD